MVQRKDEIIEAIKALQDKMKILLVEKKNKLHILKQEFT